MNVIIKQKEATWRSRNISPFLAVGFDIGINVGSDKCIKHALLYPSDDYCSKGTTSLPDIQKTTAFATRSSASSSVGAKSTLLKQLRFGEWVNEKLESFGILVFLMHTYARNYRKTTHCNMDHLKHTPSHHWYRSWLQRWFTGRH